MISDFYKLVTQKPNSFLFTGVGSTKQVAKSLAAARMIKLFGENTGQASGFSTRSVTLRDLGL